MAKTVELFVKSGDKIPMHAEKYDMSLDEKTTGDLLNKKSKKEKRNGIGKDAGRTDEGTKAKRKKSKQSDGVEPESTADSAFEVTEKATKRKRPEGEQVDKEERKRKKAERKGRKEGDIEVTDRADKGADIEVVGTGGQSPRPKESEEGDADASQPQKAHKKLEHKKSQAEETIPAEEGRKHKRKKDKSKQSSEVVEADPVPDSEQKPKKKRKRSKLEFPDPSEDESLSDQAQKALGYAFAQFADTVSWKFNKARQNWLIRNIWLEDIVPETHVPLVTRYLSNVQGGVRNTLIKTCQDILSQPIPPKPPAQVEETSADKPPETHSVRFAEPEPVVDEPPAITSAVKQLRARTLLTALTTPSP